MHCFVEVKEDGLLDQPMTTIVFDETTQTSGFTSQSICMYHYKPIAMRNTRGTLRQFKTFA